MSTKTFHTAEEVAAASSFNGRLKAGWWARGGAYTTDALAAIAAGTAVNTFLFYALDVEVPAGAFLGLLFFFWLLATAGVTALTGGQSLGHWLGGVEVVRQNGKPNTWSFSLLRDTVFRGIWFFIPLGLFVNYGWATGKDKQAVHDKMASTFVVRTDEYAERKWWVAVSFTVLLVAWFATTLALPTTT